MPDYRAYPIDKTDHIVGVHVLTCTTDDEAVNAALPLVEGHDVEVWEGGRKIVRLLSAAIK